MSLAPGEYNFDLEKYFPKELFHKITDARINNVDEILLHAGNRKRRSKITDDGKLIILAVDHPGRRVTALRNDSIGMGDRFEYLGRTLRVIADDAFDGVMTTSDFMEEIIIVDYLYKQKSGKSFLDGKVLIGCMNRGGHAGSIYELEDVFTSFTPASLKQMNLDGGKMMYRFEPNDHGSIVTIRECANAITELSRLKLYSFLEPATVENREKNYAFKTDLETLVRDLGAAAALGETSLYTWLKISYNENFERVARSTTLPIMLLGGAAKNTPHETLNSFAKACSSAPNVRGAMVGRNVAFVQNDDPLSVAAALSLIVHKGYSAEDALTESVQKRGASMDFFSQYQW